MRAEGHGHSFAAIEVRGLSYVLAYRFVSSGNATGRKDQTMYHFMPSMYADSLAFGIIPVMDLATRWRGESFIDIGGTNYRDSIMAIYKHFDINPKLYEHSLPLRGSVESHDDKWNTFYQVCNEVLFYVAPVMHIPESGIVRLRVPWREQYGSVCRAREGRIVLSARLEEYSKKRDMSAGLEELMLDLRQLKRYRLWGEGALGNVRTSDRADQGTLDEVRDVLLKADRYLHRVFNAPISTKPIHFTYRNLIAAHLEMALTAQDIGVSSATSQQEHPLDASGWAAEAAENYANDTEISDSKIVDGVLRRTSERWKKNLDEAVSDLDAAREHILDTWWIMMVRALLWNLSVQWIESERYPLRSRLLTDTTLIWIA